MEDEQIQLMDAFVGDLEKMKPLWTAWPLTLTPGLNIRRETKELISMRWWGEDDWSVMVFYSLGPGPRYRDKEYEHLSLEKAIVAVLGNIKEINWNRIEQAIKEMPEEDRERLVFIGP